MYLQPGSGKKKTTKGRWWTERTKSVCAGGWLQDHLTRRQDRKQLGNFSFLFTKRKGAVKGRFPTRLRLHHTHMQWARAPLPHTQLNSVKPLLTTPCAQHMAHFNLAFAKYQWPLEWLGFNSIPKNMFTTLETKQQQWKIILNCQLFEHFHNYTDCLGTDRELLLPRRITETMFWKARPFQNANGSSMFPF